MRRELTDQAEAMARQRVQQLGEELRDAGLSPDALAPEGAEDPLSVTVVRGPGRHARSQAGLSGVERLGERWSERWSKRWGERLPFAVPHLSLLAVIAALVLVVIAWLRISVSSDAVPVPQAHTSVSSAGPSAGPSGSVVPPTGTPAPGAPTSTGSVVVDVAGKVRRPGVLTLPAGSRVVDAVRQAGGAKAGADLTGLNLARVLVDGEQVLVGVAAAPGSGATPPAGGAADPGGGLVSLNHATLEQLETLPGVGPATAQKILDYRTAHGAFGSVDELLDVDGIGDKTLARLAPHLTL